MKKPKLQHKLRIPIYKNIVNIYFYIDNISEAVDKLKVKYPGAEFKDAYYSSAFVYDLYNEVSSDLVMCLPLRNLPESTLAHECIHAAWDILDYAGVQVEKRNHEQLAYLVGFLVGEVSVIYKQQQKFLTKPKSKRKQP